MASGKYKKNKASKLPLKKAAAKKKARKKKTTKDPPQPAITRGGISIRPCICIENDEGWFCMKRETDGELKECDGPFDTKEDCENHLCT